MNPDFLLAECPQRVPVPFKEMIKDGLVYSHTHKSQMLMEGKEVTLPDFNLLTGTLSQAQDSSLVDQSRFLLPDCLS
jgi:hypothetical protein